MNFHTSTNAILKELKLKCFFLKILLLTLFSLPHFLDLSKFENEAFILIVPGAPSGKNYYINIYRKTFLENLNKLHYLAFLQHSL